ncbi:hypothetical protein [Paraburkholderia sp.]|uniref:hypothetical protein n=1 Tax=Paraburkholderia sp. TaxID=1926495 RepID=UPI003D6FC01F
MRNFFEWFADVVLSCIVATDARSADPVIAAQRHATRGMTLSLVASAILCGFALYFTPDTDVATGLSGLAAAVQGRIVFWFSCAALVASACGLYFIVWYVLVLRWPERFVNVSKLGGVGMDEQRVLTIKCVSFLVAIGVCSIIHGVAPGWLTLLALIFVLLWATYGYKRLFDGWPDVTTLTRSWRAFMLALCWPLMAI